MKLKTLLILVLLLSVALFSVQNAAVITVHFLFWHFALSQALVILVSAVCGTVAGLAIGTLSGHPPSAAPRPDPASNVTGE